MAILNFFEKFEFRSTGSGILTAKVSFEILSDERHIA